MGYPVEPISTARERECRDRHRTIEKKERKRLHEEREGGDRDRKRRKTKTDRQMDGGIVYCIVNGLTITALWVNDDERES